MIFTGSLITIKENKLESVKEYLNNYPQVDVYSVSDDEKNIVVAIEEENDKSLEELCSKLNSHDDIINIAHHYFNFEEETEALNNNKDKNVSLEGFGKKNKKEL